MECKADYGGDLLIDQEVIKSRIRDVAVEYPVKKIDLFGSYAEGRQTEDSDVDLLVEFKTPDISLFVLSGLRIDIEESLGVSVDLLHVPLPKDSMIEIGRTVPLYEA